MAVPWSVWVYFHGSIDRFLVRRHVQGPRHSSPLDLRKLPAGPERHEQTTEVGTKLDEARNC